MSRSTRWTASSGDPKAHWNRADGSTLDNSGPSHARRVAGVRLRTPVRPIRGPKPDPSHPEQPSNQGNSPNSTQPAPIDALTGGRYLVSLQSKAAERPPVRVRRTCAVPSTCVVGLQWGDEAKGKIVDLLCDQHDAVVRYQGGANAGHTVVADGVTYKLSLIPTGHPPAGDRLRDRQRRGDPPPRPAQGDRDPGQARGRGRRPAARQRPGPRDPPLPPGRGAADRGIGLGRRPPGHDPARDRPLLSRQGRPGPRRPGRRPLPPRRSSASTWAGSSPTRTGC